MYSNRVTPIQRMRNSSTPSGSSDNGMSPRHASAATQRVGPAPKRNLFQSYGLQRSTSSVSNSRLPRSPASISSSSSMNGDYQVLYTNVLRDRASVQDARVSLASSLDQLGEHHVRKDELDQAMDAFTEALREKRSVFSQQQQHEQKIVNSPSPTSVTSTYSSSILGGNGSESRKGITGDRPSSEIQHDKAIDEIVNTLRNLGNVHSLRGEQDEAMRYFTEVSNLRSQKISMSADAASVLSGNNNTESRSMMSNLNDDTSTMMSEINEDVKALDDLFRSISFRHSQTGLSIASSDKQATSSVCSNSEKRKSRSKTHTANLSEARQKRRKSSVNTTTTSSSNGSASPMNGKNESEPFTRASSPVLPLMGNEVSDAIEMYQTVLDEHYDGPRRHEHYEMLNSLRLRADLILKGSDKKKRNKNSSPASVSSNSASSLNHDLDLALEIYNQVLVSSEESRQAKFQASLATGTTTAKSSPALAVDANLPPTPDTSIVLPDASFSLDPQEASLVASSMICMGSIYYKLGNRGEELQMYKQAKCVYQEAYGEEHVFVAGTRKNIGMVLAERGEYDAAMIQFDKAMRIYLAVNQGNDQNRDVASAISCMGNVMNRVGELDVALEKYKEALRIYQLVYKLEHLHNEQEQRHREGSPTQDSTSKRIGTSEVDALRDVTSTLKVIGMVYAKKGDFDQAMKSFQEAIGLLRTPGIAHRTIVRESLASILSRVASLYLKKADLDEAMSHYREAYDMTVKIRGSTNHPDVANILHSIGGIYHKRADYDEALACYQESIRIYHATMGPGNPTVAGTLVMVGSIYYKRRNLDSALMFYRESLRLNRDTYGIHHPDVAPILKSIGTILTKKGEYQEAYDIFRDVLQIQHTVHGSDHDEVARAYKSLGNVHYKLGDLADAERQYRHALNIYRKLKGEDHADTVSAKTTIEHLRYWMRERDESRQQEQRTASNTERS